MPFESPDIEVFRKNLDASILAIQKHKTETHSAIKIQALLNLTVYVMATRFIEGSVKHIVFNCCKMKGYNQQQLNQLEQTLKKFSNPEFSNIQSLFKSELAFDITDGLRSGKIKSADVTFLNQIVQNRHRNVHASQDSTEWYNQNKKDIDNFLQEYPGMLNIIKYLDSLVFTPESLTVTTRIVTPDNAGTNAMALTLTIPSIRVKSDLFSWLKRIWK
jgi:hypothetical protein